MDVEILSNLNSQLRDINEMLSKQSVAMSSMIGSLAPMKGAINDIKKSSDELSAATNNSSNNYEGVSKKTEAASKAVKMAEEASQKLSKSTKQGWNAVEEFMNASLIITPGVSKYTTSIVSATAAIAGFANILGPIGKVASLLLGAVAVLAGSSLKYSDATVEAYDTVAKSTGGIGTSAEGLMKMGKNAQLSSKTIGYMTKGISDLGTNILNLGGTSSQGVEMYNKLIAVGDKTLKQYRNMGYTQEQLIQAQTDFVNLNAQVGADMAKNPRELQKASLKYIDNVNRLSELTGANEKAQNDALAAAQAQENFNAHLADLEDQRANATSDAERKRLDAQIQAERNYAIIAEQLDPVKSKAILGLLASKGKPIITEETIAALRNSPEILDQINKIKKTGQDQSAELTQTIVDSHKKFMEHGGSAMTGMGQEFSDYAALYGEGNKTREFAAKMDGMSLAQRKKLMVDLNKEQEKKKNQQNDIVAQRGQIESQERQLQLNFDNILKPLSEKLNDMVIKFIPMVTNALKWTGSHIPEIEFAAKGIGVAIAGLVAVATAGKIVNTVRSFKDGFSKFMKGESGAIGTENNAAWIKLDEKSNSLINMSGNGKAGGSTTDRRISSKVDKNGKRFYYDEATGGRISKIEAMQSSSIKGIDKKGRAYHYDPSTGKRISSTGAIGAIEDSSGTSGGIINALKDAGKNAAMVILGGAALGTSLTIMAGLASLGLYAIGKSLPVVAKGFESFNKVNGKNLASVGIGVAGLGFGLSAILAGQVLNLLGTIASFGQAESPLDGAAKQLMRLQKLNLDSAKIKSNGEAAMAFGKAIIAEIGIGAVSKLVDGLNEFFDKKPPFKDFEDFSKLKINEKTIKKNAKAFVMFSEAMSSYTGQDSIGNIASAIADSVVQYFKVQTPLEKFVYFSRLDIKPKKAKANATAFKYFSEAMADYRGTGQGAIQALSQVAGTAISSLLGQKGPVDTFYDFTKLQFGPNATKNADAFFKFSEAMGILSNSGGGGITGAAGAVAGGILGAVGGVATAGASFLGNAFSAGASFLSSAASGIVKAFGSFGNWVMDTIAGHEGVRTRPYKDSLGLWTVGVGHLIGDGRSLPPQYNREFTKDEVKAMFQQDYAKHAQAASGIPGFNRLNDKGKGALIDMTFNMGPAWYRKWPNFTRALEAGDNESAANQLQGSKWAQQVGKRAQEDIAMIRAGALKAKEGGIFDGPKSGYQIELHGHEIIVPLEKDSILMKMSESEYMEETIKESHKFSASNEGSDLSISKNDPKITKLLEMDTETKEIMLYKLDRMISVLDSRHSTAKRILQSTRV